MKSGSDRKITSLIVGGVVVAILAAAVLTVMKLGVPGLDMHEQLTIGDTTFSVEIADDEVERHQGLSNHMNLEDTEGMWFVFDEEGRHGFVMRDMNFPIDIIWIDGDKQVIGSDENAQPESYPGEVFKPPLPVKYVLELPAGSVNQFDIRPGQTVEGPN